jgi:hypothetical protein
MKNDDAMVPGQGQVEPAKTRKKPYQTPMLIEYGPVQRLTQTGGSISLADGSASMRMPCL